MTKYFLPMVVDLEQGCTTFGRTAACGLR